MLLRLLPVPSKLDFKATVCHITTKGRLCGILNYPAYEFALCWGEIESNIGAFSDSRWCAWVPEIMRVNKHICFISAREYVFRSSSLLHGVIFILYKILKIFDTTFLNVCLIGLGCAGIVKQEAQSSISDLMFVGKHPLAGSQVWLQILQCMCGTETCGHLFSTNSTHTIQSCGTSQFSATQFLDHDQ